MVACDAAKTGEEAAPSKRSDCRAIVSARARLPRANPTGRTAQDRSGEPRPPRARSVPALGVFDVSSVLIGGNLTRLSKSRSGAISSLRRREAARGCRKCRALVAVGAAVDPCLDGVAVSRTGDAEGNQGRELREHVLVELRRPLRDRDQPKPKPRLRRARRSTSPSTRVMSPMDCCGAKASASSRTSHNGSRLAV
jgi:hypothetical protein